MVKKYESYKDSGIDWVGDVPEHWEVIKLKYLVSLTNEKGTACESLLKVALENLESNTGKIIDGELSFEFNGEGSLFKIGDVLFSKLRPYLAKVYLASESGIAVGELLVFRPNQEVDSKFLFYRVLSSDFIKEVNSSTYGSKMPRASWEFIAQLKIPVPPVQEQLVIAEFLSTKTSQIDTLIQKKQQLIALLEEEKTAVINEAVTKGINPGVPMKDSGVEWLGMVPEHWEVKRLKHFALIKYGLGQPPKQKDGGLPLIRATNVERGKIVEKDLLFVDPDDIPYERDPVLRKDDIIVVRSGAYTADSAIIPSKYDGAITGYDMVVRVHSANPKFISSCLLSHYVLKNQLLPHSLRAAQPHLNREELGETSFVLPPPSEQDELVDFLIKETDRISQTINHIKKEIELMKEYRPALISEAVTGKIDVREYQLEQKLSPELV